MLRQIRELSVRLADAREESQIFEVCLDSLLAILAVPRASILLFDAHDVMRFVASRGLSERYMSAVTGHTPWRPDSTNVAPIFIPDVAEDPALGDVRGTILGEGIRGLGFFPLVYGRRVIGKLMVYSDEPRIFTEHEVAAGEVIAAEVAFGLARLRAETSAAALHERLEVLLSSVPVVLWETEGEPKAQRVVYVSEHIEALLGYPLSSWYQEPYFWDQVIVAGNELEAERQSRYEEGRSGVSQLAMKKADGTIVWTEVRTTVVRDRNGKPSGFRGVTFDITERRSKEQERLDLLRKTQEAYARAEEADRRSSFLARFSEIIGRSLELEVILSSAAEILAAEIAAGCVIQTGESLGARRWVSVAHAHGDTGERVTIHQLPLDQCTGQGGELPELLQKFDGADAGGGVFEVPVIGRDQRLATLRLYFSEPVHVLTHAFVSDVASRLGAALVNAQLYHELRSANSAKDDFLAVLSHELRTPLTSIIGWASLLEQGLTEEDRQLAIRTIRTNATLQRTLIDEILDLSKLARGKITLQLAPAELESIIQSCVNTLQPIAAAKDIRLETDLPDVTVPITADAERLHQVLTNLIGNAVKFTSAGGHVSVRLAIRGDQAELTVTDTGIGIAPEFLPHVFEPFRQADSSSTRLHSGLGLGLSLVRSIVRLHQGDVVAESEGPGLGSTFRLALPLRDGARERTSDAVPATREA